MRVIFCGSRWREGSVDQFSLFKQIADNYLLDVEDLNDNEIDNPDQRIEMLVDRIKHVAEQDEVILVGEDQGGYVALVAAELVHPLMIRGIFLLRPSISMPEYAHKDYKANLKNIDIVLDWSESDTSVSNENAITYAGKAKARLLAMNFREECDYHTEEDISEKLGDIFEEFLRRAS